MPLRARARSAWDSAWKRNDFLVLHGLARPEKTVPVGTTPNDPEPLLRSIRDFNRWVTFVSAAIVIGIFLAVFFLLKDNTTSNTTTETNPDPLLAKGCSCVMQSPLESRRLQYPCTNADGSSNLCAATSTSGFSVQLFDPATVGIGLAARRQPGGGLHADYPSQRFDTYDDALTSWEGAVCGSPNNIGRKVFDPKVVWAAPTEIEDSFSAPILSLDGTELYLTTGSRAVVSLDPTTGTELKRLGATPGAAISILPIALSQTDGAFVVQSDNNHLMVFASGLSYRWNLDMETEPGIGLPPSSPGSKCAPHIFNDTLFVGSNNFIAALDMADGTVLWSFNVTDTSIAVVTARGVDPATVLSPPEVRGIVAIPAGPYVSKSLIAVHSTDPFIYVLDPDTGSLLYTVWVGGQLTMRLAVRFLEPSARPAEPQFLIGNRFGKYTLLSLNGTRLWDFDTQSPSAHAIGSSGFYPLFDPVDGEDSIYIPFRDRMFRIWADNASVIWTYQEPLKLPVASPAPMRIQGREAVVFGSDSFRMVAVSRDTGELLASFLAGDDVVSLPVIGDSGIIYTKSDDRNVYAVDFSGVELVTSTTESLLGPGYFYLESDGGPVPYLGLIYAGGRDGRIYAFRKSDGKIAWTYRTSNRMHVAPVGIDGVVVVGTGAQYTIAFSALEGTELWQFPMSNAVLRAGFSPPTVPGLAGGRRVLVPSLSGFLHCLDLQTGQQDWARVTSAASSPVVNSAGSLVFIAGSDLHVRALHMRNGSSAWTVSMGGNCGGPPLLARNETIVIFGCADSFVYALDAATGAEAWRTGAGASVKVGAALVGDTVVISRNDGLVLGLDVTSGLMRWNYSMPSSVLFPAAVHNGLAHVLDQSGELRVLDGQTGALQWTHSLGRTTIAAPSVDEFGTVFLPDDPGITILHRQTQAFPNQACGIDSVTYAKPGSGLRQSKATTVTVGFEGESVGQAVHVLVAVPVNSSDLAACVAAWTARMCNTSSSPAAAAARATFAEAYLDLPPYSCTCEEGPSLLARLSLAAAVADFAFLIISVVVPLLPSARAACKRRAERRRTKNAVGDGARGPGPNIGAENGGQLQNQGNINGHAQPPHVHRLQGANEHLDDHDVDIVGMHMDADDVPNHDARDAAVDDLESLFARNPATEEVQNPIFDRDAGSGFYQPS